MLKKRLCIVLAVIFCIFSSGFTAIEMDDLLIDYEVNDAVTVATGYLEEATYASYFYEEIDFERMSVESISDDEKVILTQEISDYSAFRTTLKAVPYSNTNLTSATMESMLDNLSLHRKNVDYHAHINELEGITYSYFTPTYDVVDCTVNGNLASVNLYERLDFQYSDCDEPSMVLTHYLVSLVKYDGAWLVMAVESDDPFYETYREIGFDLESEIRGIDEAYSQNINDISIMSTDDADVVTDLSTNSATTYQREYNAQNAVMYALTYSTSADDGQKLPSYRNEKFYWNPVSCQLFVSQCIWAGFGGSNSQTDINNRNGMDTTGSYQWWSTSTQYNNPDFNDPGSPQDQSWNSWIYCPTFEDYVDGVRSNPDESGIVFSTHSVTSSSNDMIGSSGLTQNDLIGAALHVGSGLGHAVLVNNATGKNRSNIYFTAYNNCRKNVQLSTKYPASTANSEIYVMAPQYFRNANGATDNYVYARLENAMVKGSGFSRTLYGYAKSPVTNMVMHVYKPGQSSIAYTFTSVSNDEVSGSVFFDTIGDWKVVVMGTNLPTFTYIIRIV